MTPSVYRIQKAVCSYYYVRHHEMLSNRRGWDIARPRQIAMYLARELTPHSYPAIGRFFGRDHTTVMHAIHRVEEMLAANWEIDEDIQELRERLMPQQELAA